jgi:osmotically inducible protein OsmC
MKLSFVLNENGFSPETLETESVLTFVDGVVESIDLSLSAKVSDISEEKFLECANEAKENCPISGLLNCKISLNSILI